MECYYILVTEAQMAHIMSHGRFEFSPEEAERVYDAYCREYELNGKKATVVLEEHEFDFTEDKYKLKSVLRKAEINF